MLTLMRISTVVSATVALGLAACQPQGESPATHSTAVDDAATSPAEAEATTTDESINAITGAEQVELFVGNTVIGALESFKLTWAEYFAPDGTTKTLLRFEGEDDLEVTGTYFTDDQDRFCTEYAEMEQRFGQTVFCNKIVSLGEGRYQQLWEDGTRGAIYERVLEGEQLHALDAVSDKNPQLMTVAEMTSLLVGNTIVASFAPWNMTWSEYFAPDGTTKGRFRIEDQDDVGEGTGIHYFNSKGQFCTDPEGELGPYCKWLVPLGNGKYAEVYEQTKVEEVYEQARKGETNVGVFEQVLEGDQVDAFK